MSEISKCVNKNKKIDHWKDKRLFDFFQKLIMILREFTYLIQLQRFIKRQLSGRNPFNF